MFWKGIDEKFHSSWKNGALSKDQKLAAAGLWTIAGSWVVNQETDGFVPGYMIKVWGATRELAEALVHMGLWDRKINGFTFISQDEHGAICLCLESDSVQDCSQTKCGKEGLPKNNCCLVEGGGCDSSEGVVGEAGCPSLTRPDLLYSFATGTLNGSTPSDFLDLQEKLYLQRGG
ncbi:hypothetical protein [Corynebacterium oculi]|uniref:hypothetical protein n=1 Tax=Corynebacterium oculi TaxID=1544416 RepID=UPI0012371018|nr:hypothetical protein [Corynebacterium oculi]